MVRSVLFSLAVAALIAGCTSEVTTIGGDAPESEAATLAAADTAAAADAPEAAPVTAPEAASATAAEADRSEPLAAGGGDASMVALTPANTKIGFIGTHTGDEPKPRKGSFGDFAGKVAMAGDAIRTIEVDIKTESLTTEIDKLTNHLKSPDFFDVRQFPKARFVSTSIKPGEGDQVVIVGDLTLLGKTKSISFPATVKTTEGLELKSEFTIDRTQFGMDYGLDGVEKAVTLNISVDAK